MVTLAREARGFTQQDLAERIYKEKQELQQTIFPEGIYFSKKNRETRTTKINSVFALIAGQKGVLEERETGTSEVIFKNSGLVAPRRIELLSIADLDARSRLL